MARTPCKVVQIADQWYRLLISAVDLLISARMHLVIREEGVSVDIVEVALGGVRQAGRELWHMLCSIQAEQLQQP